MCTVAVRVVQLTGVNRAWSPRRSCELRRREPGEEAGVHRLGAGWYEEQGQPEKAIAHGIAGGDTLAAARLLNRHAQDFVAAGRLRTIRGWLDAWLAITAAWMLALSGDA